MVLSPKSRSMGIVILFNIMLKLLPESMLTAFPETFASLDDSFPYLLHILYVFSYEKFLCFWKCTSLLRKVT